MKRVFFAPFFALFLSLPASSSTFQIDAAEAVLRTTYEQLIDSRAIYTYELVDRRIRIPKLCAQECQCLAEHFHQALLEHRNELGNFKTQLISLVPSELWVQMHKRNYIQHYHYHNVLLIEGDGGSWVVDPILTLTANLMPYDEWIQHFSGFRERRFDL